jgi:UPF0716 protein FxsA
VPAREVLDGLLVAVGGTLLLTPGFVTDVFGLLLVVPVTRAVARQVLMRVAARRIFGGWTVIEPPGAGRGRTQPRPSARGRVVEGEVVDGEAVDEQEWR